VLGWLAFAVAIGVIAISGLAQPDRFRGGVQRYLDGTSVIAAGLLVAFALTASVIRQRKRDRTIVPFSFAPVGDELSTGTRCRLHAHLLSLRLAAALRAAKRNPQGTHSCDGTRGHRARYVKRPGCGGKR
jgi:hypothetical protein